MPPIDGLSPETKLVIADTVDVLELKYPVEAFPVVQLSIRIWVRVMP